MDMKNKSLSHLEVAALVAHETVSLLDDRMLDTVGEFRKALETLCTTHDLGEDGSTLMEWVDSEIRSAATGHFTDLPHLIHPENLELVPHAVAQLDAEKQGRFGPPEEGQRAAIQGQFRGSIFVQEKGRGSQAPPDRVTPPRNAGRFQVFQALGASLCAGVTFGLLGCHRGSDCPKTRATSLLRRGSRRGYVPENVRFPYFKLM